MRSQHFKIVIFVFLSSQRHFMNSNFIINNLTEPSRTKNISILEIKKTRKKKGMKWDKKCENSYDCVLVVDNLFLRD